MPGDQMITPPTRATHRWTSPPPPQRGRPDI